jgi:hypothetical protein
VCEEAIRSWSWWWVVAPDLGLAVWAGGVLDLCGRRWQDKRLDRGDRVGSADERTLLQARHAVLAGRAGSVIVFGPAAALGRVIALGRAGVRRPRALAGSARE